jgi:hypothetical protein
LHSEAADCRTSQGAKLPEEQISLNEAARLFGAAMGCVWDVAHERWKRKLDRRLFRRERWIINRRRPAARFILVGLYSARLEETIRRTQWLPTTTHPWINLNAMIYQGRGREEQATKKRRPPAKIANRLRPHLMRWRAIDARRSAELHAAGLMKEGEEIRFVINRMHVASPSPERSAPLGRASSRMQALVRTWRGIRSGIPRLRGKCRQAPTCGKLLDGSA